MVIPGHNLGNSQVSVNRTIGPTLVIFLAAMSSCIKKMNDHWLGNSWRATILVSRIGS